MTDISKLIRSKVDTFTADIAALVRQDALRQISDALEGAKIGRVTKAKPGLRAAAPRAGKRTTEDLAKIGEVIVATVKATPGIGVEQISKMLRVQSIVLKLPIKKLIADGVLKTKGQKRGTKYFAK